MDPVILDEIAEANLLSGNWWYEGRRFFVSVVFDRFIQKKGLAILDVGCGSGYYIKDSERFGDVIGIDLSPRLVEHARKTRELDNVYSGDAKDLDFPDTRFNLIMALDLVEHLDDDRQGISELYRVLKKNGWLILTVPAYASLWSYKDEIAGHKRRYKKSEIERILIAQGFKILKSSHIYFFLSPVMIAGILKLKYGKKSKANKGTLAIFPNLINRMLIKVLRLESLLFPFVDYPIGTTIFIVAQK